MFYYKYKNRPVSSKHELKDLRLVQITEQEWQSLLNHRDTINENDEKIVEMNEILNWLNEHDYMINKHLLGEYQDDDERWVNYLSERAIKLARYNELENSL